MDKEVKGKEGKEGRRERNREREKERERGKGTGIIRSLGSVTGLQFQFWSAFIQMVFNLLFHTFVTSLKNDFVLLKKMYIKNNHFLSLSFFLSKNKRISLQISACTSVH